MENDRSVIVPGLGDGLQAICGAEVVWICTLFWGVQRRLGRRGEGRLEGVVVGRVCVRALRRRGDCRHDVRHDMGASGAADARCGLVRSITPPRAPTAPRPR